MPWMIGWNDVLRFLLELGALAALGNWGFTSGSGATAWALGLGAPLAAIAFWGLFVAPKARFPTSMTGRVALGRSSRSPQPPSRRPEQPSWRSPSAHSPCSTRSSC
jgi:Protein of unknown function (DUF2568)